jgi:hypothetical protein
MEQFNRVTQEKGTPDEQVINETVDIFNIYHLEDELQDTMNKFKFHQDNFNRDFQRCIYHNEKVIAYLSREVDGLSQAVKNHDKHSRMIETQCIQISETQALILAQLDNPISTNEISTRSGKRMQDPKGPEWYEREQEQRRIESQSQTQENRELLFGGEEPEEQVHQDTQEDEVEVEKEVDSDAETTDVNNNEEEAPEAEEEEEPREERSK